MKVIRLPGGLQKNELIFVDSAVWLFFVVLSPINLEFWRDILQCWKQVLVYKFCQYLIGGRFFGNIIDQFVCRRFFSIAALSGHEAFRTPGRKKFLRREFRICNHN